MSFLPISILFVVLFVIVVGGSAIKIMHETWLKERAEKQSKAASK